MNLSSRLVSIFLSIQSMVSFLAIKPGERERETEKILFFFLIRSSLNYFGVDLLNQEKCSNLLFWVFYSHSSIPTPSFWLFELIINSICVIYR